VFVVPFDPDQECSAGRSKPNRPLGELYDSLYERCEEAYDVSLLGLLSYIRTQRMHAETTFF
jgi:hypothetical protein